MATEKSFFAKLSKEKVAITALQETRETISGIIVRHGFICCMSGSHKGNLGCQVCINTKVAWYSCDGIDQYISADNVSILDFSPRHIICKCTMKYCCIYIVGFHAPYQGCKEDPVAWWNNFKIIVGMYCRINCHILFLFDGNSQFFRCDTTTHGEVGVLSASAPDNFKAMSSFLTCFDQVMHSTFLDNYQIEHRRDYSTFIPNHGNKDNNIRIDYISSSPSISCVPGSLAVNDSLALFLRVDSDHRPLTCMIALKLSKGSAPQRRRVINYDKDSFLKCPQLTLMLTILLTVILLMSLSESLSKLVFPNPRTSKKKRVYLRLHFCLHSSWTWPCQAIAKV